MQPISVFLDMAKFDNFRLKNADFSRGQRLFLMINIFCGSSLGKAELFQVSSLQDMWETFLGGGLFAPPPPPYP